MKNKVIMDTNVPVKAATSVRDCKDEELEMQKQCIEYIKKFIDNPKSKLVLDIDYKILREYYNRIPNTTGLGKLFLKWLNSYKCRIAPEDNIHLDMDSEGNYVDFPLESRTEYFDWSDRKFIALARVHHEHPPVIQAADGKWYGYKDIFEEYGIHIEFLDEAYAEMMYKRKISEKRVN